MTTYSPILVGVFQNENSAKNALDTLKQAGFQKDQLGLALDEGGVVTNNLRDDLVRLGIPQDRAEYYESEFRSGHPVLSVRADGREQEVNSVFQQYGAQIDNTSMSKQAYTDQQTYDQNAAYVNNQPYADQQFDNQNQAYINKQSYTDQQNYTNDNPSYADQQNYNQDNAYTNDQSYANQQNYNQDAGYARDQAYTDQQNYTQGRDRRAMPLREEVLDTNKERVQSGEARLHKEVVSENRQIDVPVTHEEVVVERHNLPHRPVSDTPIGEDETIRVPVSEEQVNVTKTPVTTGEVEIGKRAVQKNQRVNETVRREEARLEREGDPNIRTNDNFDQR